MTRYLFLNASFLFPFPAPSPTSAIHYLATKCVDNQKGHHSGRKWFVPWGDDQCDSIRDLNEATERMIEANAIVFSVHIPMSDKEMSPWFQFMLVILQFDIAFKRSNQISESAGFNPTTSNEPKESSINLFALIRDS